MPKKRVKGEDFSRFEYIEGLLMQALQAADVSYSIEKVRYVRWQCGADTDYPKAGWVEHNADVVWFTQLV